MYKDLTAKINIQLNLMRQIKFFFRFSSHAGEADQLEAKLQVQAQPIVETRLTIPLSEPTQRRPICSSMGPVALLHLLPHHRQCRLRSAASAVRITPSAPPIPRRRREHAPVRDLKRRHRARHVHPRRGRRRRRRDHHRPRRRQEVVRRSEG